MLSARYGRMKVGRCVEEEPGLETIMRDPRYLGCFTDVMDVVSRQCSGRTQCTLRVNDQNFDNVKPCYANLKMYLEATYWCISGKRRVVVYTLPCRMLRTCLGCVIRCVQQKGSHHKPVCYFTSCCPISAVLSPAAFVTKSRPKVIYLRRYCPVTQT